QAGVVVDDEDLFTFGQGGRVRHRNSQNESGGHYRPGSGWAGLSIVSRFFPDQPPSNAKLGRYNAALLRRGVVYTARFRSFYQVD
ncbi:hypothetical protein Q4R45_23245, partial [Morganella morganii subsp. sibonii]